LHNGVLSRRGNTRARGVLGQLNAGLIFGISSRMWLEEHSAHHAYTLRPHGDPQFKYFPLWLQSTKEIPCWKAELPTDLRLRRWASKAVRCLVRLQHLTFLPIVLLIGRYNFMAISVAFAVRNRRWFDLLSIVAHLLWYGTFVALLLPTALERALFVVTNFSLIGVLHVQLLLSHLSTQQFTPEEEERLGVFAFQLFTTRNIKSHWYSHWFHGGLEMQIEHHLFPLLPRHKLRAVAPRVRALAERHGIPYVELGFGEALRYCLVDLSHTAMALANLDFL